MFEVIEDGWHSFLPEQEFEFYSSAVSQHLTLWVIRTDTTLYFTCENPLFPLKMSEVELGYSCLKLRVCTGCWFSSFCSELVILSVC
jgi:hypothetical protein